MHDINCTKTILLCAFSDIYVFVLEGGQMISCRSASNTDDIEEWMSATKLMQKSSITFSHRSFFVFIFSFDDSSDKNVYIDVELDKGSIVNGYFIFNTDCDIIIIFQHRWICHICPFFLWVVANVHRTAAPETHRQKCMMVWR